MPSLPSVNDDGASVLQASTPADATGVVQPPQLVNKPGDVSEPIVNAPVIADDVDLIEKEWINNIREIIQHTRGDPYERARQLALLKNEYLQKRYQKNVNLT
jgi:hypothetical protein